MAEYKEKLRSLTKTSNDFLLTVVEDLTYSFSDNREKKWNPETLERYREGFLNQLLAERDGFVYRNEEVILNSLRNDTGLIVIVDVQSVATSA